MKIATLFFAAWAACLVSAPQPAPSGQKAADTAQQQSKSNKHASQPTPSAPPKTEENTAQHPANQNGGTIKGGENERAVRVVGLPPRSTGDTVALVCTVVLTLVGIVGIVAAFCTLRAIVRDADATQEAARATQASVELQKTAMEQWVDTEKWETEYLFTQEGAEILPIRFRIKNPTKFKITLLKAVCWINGRRIVSIHFRKQLLAPDGYTTAEVHYPLVAGQITAYRKETLRFEIGGVICFVDAFGKTQEQPFGYMCTCRSPDKAIFEPTSFVPPSEDENKAKGNAT